MTQLFIIYLGVHWKFECQRIALKLFGFHCVLNDSVQTCKFHFHVCVSHFQDLCGLSANSLFDPLQVCWGIASVTLRCERFYGELPSINW